MLCTSKGLKVVGLGEDKHVYIKELPVSYTKAQQVIADMWQTLNPKVNMLAMIGEVGCSVYHPEARTAHVNLE